MSATAECNRLIHRIGHHPGKMRHKGYSLHFLARLDDSEWFQMTTELIITGRIENYFQGTQLHTINNPNPPTDPTHTNQRSLDDFVTRQSQDDTADVPSPPSRQTTTSRRHTKTQRRKIRKRHDKSDISNPQAIEPPHQEVVTPKRRRPFSKAKISSMEGSS